MVPSSEELSAPGRFLRFPTIRMMRVFKCRKCKHELMLNVVLRPHVAEEDKAACPQCGSKDIEMQ